MATDWDMRDKAPFHLDWKCAHLFGLHQDGALMPQRFNIELVAGDWERATPTVPSSNERKEILCAWLK